MNVCTIRVGPSSAETLARFHLGQPPVDPGAIGLGRSDAHAWSGQTLAVIAGFGPRSAVLPNCPAVAVRPSMAQSDLANADEVRGCVARARAAARTAAMLYLALETGPREARDRAILRRSPARLEREPAAAGSYLELLFSENADGASNRFRGGAAAWGALRLGGAFL